jgi:hypothetical protein
MSCVKGSGVLAVYEHLASLQGPQGMEKIKAALNREDEKIFASTLLPITWVDFGYFMRMVVTADRVLGKGDFKVVEAAARYNMNKNFRGLYKILISFTNPKFAFNNAQTLWRQWFDHGKITTEWVGDKAGVARLADFPDMPPNHEHNLTPSIDEIIRLSSGKNTTCIHQKCVLKGAPYCEWKLSWE